MADGKPPVEQSVPNRSWNNFSGGPRSYILSLQETNGSPPPVSALSLPEWSSIKISIAADRTALATLEEVGAR